MAHFRSTMALLASLALPLAAQATPALTSWSGGIAATSGSDQLYGWSFHVINTITVNALGVFDLDGDGLAIAHDVGLYNAADQSLLASTTVAAGTSAVLDAGFRYSALGASVVLGEGDYVIVMTMPALNADRQFIGAETAITIPEIAYLNSAFAGGSALAFPDPSFDGSFSVGMFGPNLQVEPVGNVPEPGSFALMLAGLMAAAGFARRRGQRDC